MYWNLRLNGTTNLLLDNGRNSWNDFCSNLSYNVWKYDPTRNLFNEIMGPVLYIWQQNLIRILELNGNLWFLILIFIWISDLNNFYKIFNAVKFKLSLNNWIICGLNMGFRYIIIKN